MGAKLPVITATVIRGDLPITVVERGELESSQSIDVACEVEREQIKIVSILPEGTRVTKGTEVVRLDTDALLKAKSEQEIKWKTAEGKAKATTSALEVAKNKRESEIEKARLAWELAEIDRDSYLDKEGDYKAEENDRLGAIELAKKQLQESESKRDFYRDFVQKGFGTPENLRRLELDVAEKQFLLTRDTAKLLVLQKFTRKKKEAELRGKADEAKREWKRTEKSQDAEVEKATSEKEAADITARLEKTQLERLEEQLGKCVIKAPHDGILVYSKFRYWDPTSRIQAGAMVHFRQPIFSLPDLGKMQVKVKIHESVVKKISQSLPAEIQIEALPNRILHGTVKNVGTLAVTDGWTAGNVKEYLTIVEINDLPSDAGLKPGMTAEVKVLARTLKNVIQVPLQAVTEIGGKHFAYVVDADNDVEKRSVTLGESNERFVEIREGLDEAEKVALDARARGSAEAKKATADPPSPNPPPAKE
jgi:RND family efflux transporter MFP subunit